jgi:hypothetical protein
MFPGEPAKSRRGSIRSQSFVRLDSSPFIDVRRRSESSTTDPGEHLPKAGHPVGKDCQARDLCNSVVPAELPGRRPISLGASAPNDTAKYLVAYPLGSGIT